MKKAEIKHQKSHKLDYTSRASGQVVTSRAATVETDDPLRGQFLTFLASDITSHPERLQVVDVGLVQRIQSLVAGVDVVLDEALLRA